MSLNKYRLLQRVTFTIDILAYAFGVIAAIAMFVVAINTTYEAILRRLFNSPTTWVFSTSLFVMVWFPLLAAPLVIKEGRQIKVDLFFAQLPKSIQHHLNIINYILSFILLGVLAYCGTEMCIDAYNRNVTSVELFTYPQFLLYLVFPITSTLLILQVSKCLIHEILQIREDRESKTTVSKLPLFIILSSYFVLLAFAIVLTFLYPIAGVFLLALCMMIFGLPISFSLGTAGIAGLFLLYGGSASLGFVPVIVERTLHNFILLAVPLFIMGGVILEKSGVGERLFDAASKLLSGLPGGLAVATILACAVFSAMVGVSTAVAAGIGLAAIPALLSRGYSKELAYGSVSGGALGVLIPPSAGLIVYGFLTNSSVGQLFAAAIVPAGLIVFLFATYSIVFCMATGKYEKLPFSWRETVVSIKRALLGIIAPVIVLFGIYSGLVTPTEAAGVLVLYSFVVYIIYKGPNLRDILNMLKDAAILGSAIMMIMVGGMILANLVIRLQVALLISEWITASGMHYWVVMCLIIAFYIVLGMFLDGLSMTLLTVPILFPLMPILGVDVIVFGVMLMILLEAALLTPPVGMNLFMVQAITKDRLWPIVKGNLPFALILGFGAVVVLLFPSLSLWLPKQLGF